MEEKDRITVGLAQIAPVWLNKRATTEKIVNYIADAALQGCQLVVFGEALLPGYPFWLSPCDGAAFDHPIQKQMFAHYLDQAVCIEHGDLNVITRAAAKHKINVYLGIVEAAKDRGGHSLYCSLVFINQEGDIASVHRKLMPTYEERLVWGQGDGQGLITHQIGAFRAGGLNCWENWMPLARASLYAQGEDLHVAVWPGGEHNTRDITCFIAKESRSYVLSVSGLLRPGDIPDGFPLQDSFPQDNQVIANGGSCIAAPDGSWLLPPNCDEETLLLATLDHQKVREERQNFDPAGHYARPDVLQLSLNPQRQTTLNICSD